MVDDELHLHKTLQDGHLEALNAARKKEDQEEHDTLMRVLNEVKEEKEKEP